MKEINFQAFWTGSLRSAFDCHLIHFQFNPLLLWTARLVSTVFGRRVKMPIRLDKKKRKRVGTGIPQTTDSIFALRLSCVGTTGSFFVCRLFPRLLLSQECILVCQTACMADLTWMTSNQKYLFLPGDWDTSVETRSLSSTAAEEKTNWTLFLKYEFVLHFKMWAYSSSCVHRGQCESVRGPLRLLVQAGGASLLTG